MPPPVPRCSGWASSSLISPDRISLPRYGGRVGLHIDLFGACSAFTRVAACTLAQSPIVTANRRLQPFRYLHDCSDCFRLERIAGWGLHPLESAAFARRTPKAVIICDATVALFSGHRVRRLQATAFRYYSGLQRPSEDGTMREKTVNIPTADGQIETFVVHPEESGPFAPVIIYMDVWGLRPELCDIARKVAVVG